MVVPIWLFIKIAEPAGLILIEERSPPKAPKAPLIALKRAVPLMFSWLNRNASEIFWDCATPKVKPANKIKMDFFISFQIKIYTKNRVYRLPDE